MQHPSLATHPWSLHYFGPPYCSLTPSFTPFPHFLPLPFPPLKDPSFPYPSGPPNQAWNMRGVKWADLYFWSLLLCTPLSPVHFFNQPYYSFLFHPSLSPSLSKSHHPSPPFHLPLCHWHTHPMSFLHIYFSIWCILHVFINMCWYFNCFPCNFFFYNSYS